MNKTLSVPLTKSETLWGICYLVIEFCILPGLLSFANAILPTPLDSAALNFVFYAINFGAVIWIFRRFLGKNLDNFFHFPLYSLWVVLIGLAQYMVFNQFMGYLIYFLEPTYINANDANISQMVNANLGLMALSTVLLVPPAEECLFRGLIFRNLYDKSAALAWVVSTIAFAAIHIIGYAGVYTPTELLISFLQYVPAGIALAWAYTKADSILAPILIHAIVNAIGIYIMRL